MKINLLNSIFFYSNVANQIGISNNRQYNPTLPIDLDKILRKMNGYSRRPT